MLEQVVAGTNREATTTVTLFATDTQERPVEGEREEEKGKSQKKATRMVYLDQATLGERSGLKEERAELVGCEEKSQISSIMKQEDEEGFLFNYLVTTSEQSNKAQGCNMLLIYHQSQANPKWKEVISCLDKEANICCMNRNSGQRKMVAKISRCAHAHRLNLTSTQTLTPTTELELELRSRSRSKLIRRKGKLITSKTTTQPHRTPKIDRNDSNLNRREQLAFFSTQYQHKYQHKNNNSLTAPSSSMIIKLLLLLSVMLSTNCYLSFGIRNNNVSANINFNDDRQLNQATTSNINQATSAAQATRSSNNNLVLDQASLLVYDKISKNVYHDDDETNSIPVEAFSSSSGLNKVDQATSRANLKLNNNFKRQTEEAETARGSNNNAGTEENNKSNSDSDNLTQIPQSDQIVTTTTTTTTLLPSHLLTTTKKSFSSSGSTKRSVPMLRVTESDLLPFSEFLVQQPAFSDLMKSWPPTTLPAVSIFPTPSSTPSPYSAVSSAHLQANRLRHARQHYGQTNWQRGNQFNRHNSGLNENNNNNELDEYELMKLMRNHLNEDLDDTIITADQSFEQDQLPEPPTWINYLGELGDNIYMQLRQYLEMFSSSSSARAFADSNRNDQDNSNINPTQAQPTLQQQQRKLIETIDELLDDYYYDQYENSQVLYYGSQLVREGDIFEIGCYLPSDQSAEWTKSGRLLSGTKTNNGANSALSSYTSPRVIRRSDFLGAKQNFSLKVFEASLSDTGNYRCNKMSRKYHKLVVVPLKTTTTQLYMIQQRLLSVVNPSAVSMPGLNVGSRFSAFGVPTLSQSKYNNNNNNIHSSSSQANSALFSSNSVVRSNLNQTKARNSADHLILPGYLIVENQPLVVNCNITDEFVLRRLKENPQFQLAWLKNGKLLRGSSNNNHYQMSSSGHVLPESVYMRFGTHRHSNLPGGANQRIQYLLPNGRQLYITSATYSDAGEYLCSWSKLPARHQPAELEGDEFRDEHQNQNGPTNSKGTISNNLLGAGNLVQVMAPVKLRPFKSAYHVRQGNQLRLVCLAQRGYPPAHISWYVGNRLVDSEFLQEHPNEFRILHLQNQNQLIVTSSPNMPNQDTASSSYSESSSDKKKLVEINPIPLNRHQMQLTANGRGSWVEYRDLKSEKYAIETSEQQLKYLKQKLAQLMGSTQPQPSPSSNNNNNNNAEEDSSSSNTFQSQPMEGNRNLFVSAAQTSVSVLVINSLDIEKHTSRYACRATTRANTDEVTTVVRVQASSTITVRPSTGRATLIPGQPLHFQCETVDNKNAEFLWYRRPLNEEREEMLEPNNDDTIEIHNDRLTLHKPTSQLVGDYYCRALRENDKTSTIPNEFAVIKLRMQPYIEDFGLETSHTGKSSVVTDGDRLELTCTVRDTTAPVNITWLRSYTPDDETKMVPLPETPSSSSLALPFSPSSPQTLNNHQVSPFSHSVQNDPFAQTFTAPDQNIVIESLGTHSKRLVIESIRHEHRSYYVCMADNGITERSRKIIFIRVKDKLVALWPFLGIVAELFILFTIIHVWETQSAYKEIHAVPPPLVASSGTSSIPATGSKPGRQPGSNAGNAFESVPLTSG